MKISVAKPLKRLVSYGKFISEGANAESKCHSVQERNPVANWIMCCFYLQMRNPISVTRDYLKLFE